MSIWGDYGIAIGSDLSTKEKLKMELRSLSYMLENWEKQVFRDKVFMTEVFDTYNCLENEYKKLRSLYEQYMQENG